MFNPVRDLGEDPEQAVAGEIAELVSDLTDSPGGKVS